MKILKSPNAVIYDTTNIDSRNFNPFKGFGNPIPLHQTHEKTDHEFLSEHFPPEHPIFNDFSKSYYYRLSV
jgi:hypothetical protein